MFRWEKFENSAVVSSGGAGMPTRRSPIAEICFYPDGAYLRFIDSIS